MPSTTRDDLTAALDNARITLATDARDWSLAKGDAWLYGIFAGWDCEDDHEHDDICGGTDAMRAVAARHGWNDKTVAVLRRHRAAIAAELIERAQEITTVSPVGADTPSAAVTAEQVDHAAEALKDVRLRIGPNTRALIADGTWETMPLTGAERREIARIVLSASGEVPQ